MILSKPEKYKFEPIELLGGYKFSAGTEIEIKSIWGKSLYKIKYEGRQLTMNNYVFNGDFEYLKITRREDQGMGTMNVQLFCDNCGETVYKLSLKLPSLFIIKTDFHVTKDRG